MNEKRDKDYSIQEKGNYTSQERRDPE